MRRKISGLLCLVLALMMVVGSVPAMAEQTAKAGGLTVLYADMATEKNLNFDSTGATSSLVGHKLMPGLLYEGSTKLLPSDIKFKSSKSKVASVNANGIITLKKVGTATITLTQKSNKNNTFKFTIRVNENAANRPIFTVEPGTPGFLTDAKKVYVKGGQLMIDMYVYNGTQHKLVKIEKAPTYMTLTENRDDSYEYIGDMKGKAKSNIKPGKIGVVTFKTGLKVDLASIDLTKANAFCYGDISYVYRKSGATDVQTFARANQTK